MFAQYLRELISRLRLETFGLASRYKKTHSLGTVVRLPLSGLSKLLLAGTICLEPVLAANLSIKFVDPDGRTLPKVDVRITHLITHRFEQVISDRQGKIEVAGLTDGKYELLAQLRNFFSLKEEIELTGDMLLEKVMFNQKFVDRANKEVAETVEKGEFARSVDTLQRLLKLFPDKAALHFNMAVAQGGLLNEEKAMDEIDTAIRLEPGPKYQDKKREIQRDLSRELGQKALNDQDFPRATSLYQKLTEIDPQNARAFYGLALSLGHQRKYQEALVAIDQAIRLEPNEQQYQKVKEMLEANAKSP